MNPAIGIIETLGLVPLLNAVDAALKAANVTTISTVMKLDGGIVAVMISGDVSSVRAAVEAAAEAAARIGLEPQGGALAGRQHLGLVGEQRLVFLRHVVGQVARPLLEQREFVVGRRQRLLFDLQGGDAGGVERRLVEIAPGIDARRNNQACPAPRRPRPPRASGRAGSPPASGRRRRKSARNAPRVHALIPLPSRSASVRLQGLRVGNSRRP